MLDRLERDNEVESTILEREIANVAHDEGRLWVVRAGIRNGCRVNVQAERF